MNRTTQFKNYFQVFRDILRAVHASTSIKEVLDFVVVKSSEVLNAKGAVLRIIDKETKQFKVRAVCGIGEHYFQKGPVTTEKLLPNPHELHKVIIITDIWNAPRVEYPQQAWDEGIRMMLDVPLAIENKLVGLIRIYLEKRRKFTEDELDFILTVAEQCTCIIERVQLIENQQTQFHHLASHVDKMESLGRIAAGIAHEINNPLASILLYSSNLIKKLSKGGAHEEVVQIIIEETQRCKTIIQGLLDFARDKEPQKVQADINNILEKALSILDNEFHLRHIRIERRLSKNMVSTFLDKNQIEQVFINLLLNATQAIGDQGIITIHSGVNYIQNRITVEISDNGCGIAEENIEKIFDPFFSTKASGTGLGLAVS